MNTDTLWFEISIVCGMTAFGNIFFGHFEAHTPRIRRVIKLILINTVVVLLSVYAGRVWSFGLLGLMLVGVLYVHGFWLPRNGINGLTGEPKSKYYKLRGWEKYLDKDKDSR